MKVAVMQPYFFPYLGYFQLIEAVDYFVIFDDVNYIKRGWVNSNRILKNGKIVDITLPLQKASQNKKINAHFRSTDIKVLATLKKKIQFSYSMAPHFNEVFPLLCQLIDNPETNLAKYLTESLRELSTYLGLKTQFVYSSELSAHDDWDHAEQRIIAISKQLGGTEYYNLPGGRQLYNEKLFLEHNLSLEFITPELKAYKQNHTDKFIPGLSVIDFIMLGELSKK
ncbi:MAG: hypothetical protein ACJAXH_000165 [Colwellia sp.]|jgi:hypothetical protein